MLEPSLHRQRHTVLDVTCRVRLSSFLFILFFYHFISMCMCKEAQLQGGPKKTGPFLNVDNFAMVSDRNLTITHILMNFHSALNEITAIIYTRG